MKPLFSIGIALFIGITTVKGQDLYIPRNIQKAYRQETRSMTGQPGKNYWQNKGVYKMQLKVTPQNRRVDGRETIHYQNNSPDTLKELVIRFVNNIHKPNAPRGYYAPNDFLDSGLVISRLEIDGKVYQQDAKNWGTVGTIPLKESILPHSSSEIKIDWHYRLSKRSGREGQIDSTTFFVAYSYPRISVYDDYNGWDKLEHTGRQEFYNDFNDYEFSVTVPKDYVVYASGDLLNAADVLTETYYKRLEESYRSDRVISVVDTSDLRKGGITLQNEWNEWKFSVKHISDVCFALSNHYVWDASSVIVDSVTGRRASVQAAYVDTSKDFQHYVEWARFSLNYFSKAWPGIPYPFSKMTSFQGFANMEYPMMVNDAPETDLRFARLLQDHEMLHSYFPFYMGINETRYAFMDEGWTTFFEYWVGKEEFGKEAADDFFINFRSKRYINNLSQENDQPMIIQSSQQNGAGYGSNSYGKAALFYFALKDYLGDEVFKKCLHTFMNQWNGKHPMPWDFFNSFRTTSGEKLDWFYQNWFFESHYIDLKIDMVMSKKNKMTVVVQNVGGFAIPLDLMVYYDDETTKSYSFSPEVWKYKSKEVRLTFRSLKNKKVKRVEMKNGIFWDFTPGDNSVKM